MATSIALTDLNILLVEPSDTQKKIINKHLKESCVNYIENASNLAQAKAAIDAHQPDLVISAMYFEDGTGLELFHAIKTRDETESIPCMLISSEYRPEKLEEFKQAGVVAILPKPFEPVHLERALNATLELLNTDELNLELFDVHDVRVLLVDDSKTARRHIRRVLEKMGLQHITEAENGANALSALKQSTFDLVVTDYNMPEMDGRELSEFIRFNTATAHLPIIMVTSEANNTSMKNIQQTGVNALCDKPFEPAEVKQILVNLLNKQ